MKTQDVFTAWCLAAGIAIAIMGGANEIAKAIQSIDHCECREETK